MSDRRAYAIMAACLVLAVIASYLLALAGEPQSEWMWRDVLGVIE